jgi:hypothetical protein
MSTAAIPSTEPTQFASGDSISWTKNLPDYQPSDGWSLLYCFRGNKLIAHDFTSNSSLVSLSTTDTASILPGLYSVAGYAVNTGQRVQIFIGEINATANLQTAPSGKDLRTQNRRTLDNINAVIEGRASSTVLKSEVEGTRLERIPHKDLLDLQALYQVKVRNEEIVLLQSQGRPTGRTVFIQFSRPK